MQCQVQNISSGTQVLDTLGGMVWRWVCKGMKELNLVDEERDGLHQVSHDNEITTWLYIKSQDMTMMRWFILQLPGTIFPECPLVQLYLLIYPCQQLSIECIKVIHSSFGLFLCHQLQLAIFNNEHKYSPLYKFEHLDHQLTSNIFRAEMKPKQIKQWQMKTLLHETYHCEHNQKNMIQKYLWDNDEHKQ